jgi:hypothetical protein
VKRAARVERCRVPEQHQVRTGAIVHDLEAVTRQMALEKAPRLGLGLGEQQRRRHVSERTASIAARPDVLSRESVTNDLQTAASDGNGGSVSRPPSPSLQDQCEPHAPRDPCKEQENHQEIPQSTGVVFKCTDQPRDAKDDTETRHHKATDQKEQREGEGLLKPYLLAASDSQRCPGWFIPQPPEAQSVRKRPIRSDRQCDVPHRHYRRRREGEHCRLKLLALALSKRGGLREYRAALQLES